MASRLRGRPAHTPGPTFLSYCPKGDKLVTVGLNNAIRVFQSGSDEEPTNIDNVPDSNTAVVAGNDFFIVGSEDGTVTKYSFYTGVLPEILTRCSLPIRDIALSPDGNWAAVASDELVIKVVNTHDMKKVMHLREQSRPVKHVSFDPSGTILAASCSDGTVNFYSLSSEEPHLLKKLPGLIQSLETDSEASSKIVWHPSGAAFGAATNTRDFQVVSRDDWENKRAFKNGHNSSISAAAWSPQGSLLATASIDRHLVLWDSRTQTILKTFDNVRATILAMEWHPKENILSYTNNDGELYIHNDFVPEEHVHLLSKGIQKLPTSNGMDLDSPPNGLTNGHSHKHRHRSGTPDSVDRVLDFDPEDEDDDFIVDDDGAGYAEVNRNGKRSNHADSNSRPFKLPRSNVNTWQPKLHESFQSGSTPWRGNRRYLCLNLVGVVWTLDQGTHHTVTVEFYDRDQHRDFHFTDSWMYDKACLNDSGTLFACPPLGSEPAHLYYRPHETWTTRSDWRTALPYGESITAMSLTDSYIFATTSAGYVRVFSHFGIPVRIFRQSAVPAITCAAHGDTVLAIGNGPTGNLLCEVYDARTDKIHQTSLPLSLPSETILTSAFFTERGDPCVYDSSGVLSILARWREPGQARWVPLLDTNLLERRFGTTGDRKREETYWPVAVTGDRFHCFILKGAETHPYFPRPLLSDFEFCVPLVGTILDSAKAAVNGHSADDNFDDEDIRMNGNGIKKDEETPAKLEHKYFLSSLLAILLEDKLQHGATNESSDMDVSVRKDRQDLEADKALLQILASECLAGDERGMRALDAVKLIKDGNGKMLEAAKKVALRYGREVLAEKIVEVQEDRLLEAEE